MATEIVSFHTDSDDAQTKNEIRQQIVSKLADKKYRDIFVSEQINTGLAFQIRAMREGRNWTQAELGRRTGMAQSRVSVMEDANYSRFSLTTLKRLASAFDVALAVRFAPFSELADYFVNLSADSLNVPSFEQDRNLTAAEKEITFAGVNRFLSDRFRDMYAKIAVPTTTFGFVVTEPTGVLAPPAVLAFKQSAVVPSKPISFEKLTPPYNQSPVARLIQGSQYAEAQSEGSPSYAN